MLASPPSPASIKQCCARSALNVDAAFCDDCGSPLLRCMAHTECGGLLSDTGICSICVDLELSLDTGTASSVREGGKLALPLVIKNASRVGRPLFITGIWIKEDDGELRELSLPFERLDPQTTTHIAVRTGRLDHAGTHRVDLLIAVATRYQWREERYVFSSDIAFPVEPKDPGGPATTINVKADEIGAGFTVYNPTRIEADRAAGISTSTTPILLNIKRADAAERNLEQRGYSDGLQVRRNVELVWRGFEEGAAPFDGVIARPSGLLHAGRNSRENGNDLCLRLGEEDKALAMSISRLLFSLYAESGRFILRVEGQYGLRINGESFERTENIPLHHGDLIQPLRKQPDVFGIKVGFETQHEEVRRIMMTRIPAKTGN